MEEQPKIIIEETNLEDLILLGEDKLINIKIEYPTDKGEIKTKAKIKQLTIKELKNLPLTKNDIDIKVVIQILQKSLFKQDETPFDRNLILKLPVGVATIIAEKILEISGVNKKDDDMGF